MEHEKSIYAIAKKFAKMVYPETWDDNVERELNKEDELKWFQQRTIMEMLPIAMETMQLLTKAFNAGADFGSRKEGHKDFTEFLKDTL